LVTSVEIQTQQRPLGATLLTHVKDGKLVIHSMMKALTWPSIRKKVPTSILSARKTNGGKLNSRVVRLPFLRSGFKTEMKAVKTLTTDLERPKFQLSVTVVRTNTVESFQIRLQVNLSGTP
jgi:hypothetical protein